MIRTGYIDVEQDIIGPEFIRRTPMGFLIFIGNLLYHGSFIEFLEKVDGFSGIFSFDKISSFNYLSLEILTIKILPLQVF